MEQELIHISTLLQQLPQAAFWLRKGVVAGCNRAAFARNIQLGLPLEDYLNPQEARLAAACTSGTMELQLILDDGLEAATLCSMGKYQVVVLRQIREPLGLAPNTLANISNSLRSPLTELHLASLSLAELAASADSPELEELMTGVTRSFHRLMRLSSNLAIAGWDLSDGLVLNRERTAIVPYFQSLCQRLKPSVEAAGLKFRCRLPRAEFSGFLDRMRVEQAILQLISNAIRYSPPGGTVVFHVSREKTKLTIRVADQGEGVREDVEPTLFFRYSRPQGMEDPRWGAGFGLYLAQRIAALHTGRLELRPREKGGAEAVMTLNLKNRTGDELAMRTPMSKVDTAGGFRRELVELADVLPRELYDSKNL